MGGKDARDGFWFQDATVLLRLLLDAIERRARLATGEEPEPLLEVRIEAAVDPGPSAAQEAPRPLWDSTYSREGATIVDESKLDDLTPKDRKAFYQRIRATRASGVAVESLYPRLTIARDGLANVAKWRDLAAEVRTATPQQPAERASTAQDLASEGLFYLTDPGAHSAAPLSLEDARAVLGRFLLDNQRSLDEVEQELANALATVGARPSVVQVIDQLGGWISRAARERKLPIVLTSESLSREVELAAKYLEVPQAVQDLWRRLREANPVLPPSNIPTQGWREVQPGVGALSKRQVLTGPGGSGKSYVLAQLHAETTDPRVWINAQVTAGLEEAISFGAWACSVRQESLIIFIEALDAVASPGEFLATIDRALVGCDATVVVGSRPGSHSAQATPLPAEAVGRNGERPPPAAPGIGRSGFQRRG